MKYKILVVMLFKFYLRNDQNELSESREGNERAESLAGDAASDNNHILDPPTVINPAADNFEIFSLILQTLPLEDKRVQIGGGAACSYRGALT